MERSVFLIGSHVDNKILVELLLMYSVSRTGYVLAKPRNQQN